MKRVLLVSASIGGGHARAADALAHAFRSKSVEVEQLDILQLASPVFRLLYADIYLALYAHCPEAIGWFYNWYDQPGGEKGLRAWWEQANIQRFREKLTGGSWDAVVHTHFLSACGQAWWRREGKLRTPSYVVVTDLLAHRFWMHEPCDGYYVATEEAAEFLAVRGVRRDTIKLAGIPLMPGFSQPPSRAEARARLGLPATGPVVLQLAGGFALGPVESVTRTLLRASTPMTLVVVTGRNAALKARLERGVQPAPHALKVIGFTDVMHDWMAAADLVVTKPGGVSSSEAIAVGTPVLFVQVVPGQESRNVSLLLESGAASAAPTLDTLPWRIDRFFRDPSESNRRAGAARSLARPDAAARIVSHLLERVG